MAVHFQHLYREFNFSERIYVSLEISSFQVRHQLLEMLKVYAKQSAYLQQLKWSFLLEREKENINKKKLMMSQNF